MIYTYNYGINDNAKMISILMPIVLIFNNTKKGMFE